WALELTPWLSGGECRGQCGAALVVDGQGGGHEIAPDLRRNGPAAHLAERFVVVAADPHPNDEIARETDEERIAILLRRAGLAERGHGEGGAAAGAVVGGGVEQVEHRCSIATRIEQVVRAKESREALGLRSFRQAARNDR